MNSVADIWNMVLQQLKKELAEITITTWFDEVEAVAFQDNIFYLYCPVPFKRENIEKLYLEDILTALRQLFSKEIKVVLLDDRGLADFRGTAPKRSAERFTSADFTFESFVVGESNKLAHAAAKSVAEHPGQNYNPLLIYGDSGLGKTHLIYAIANVIRKNDPEAKIAYVKGDDLTNELVAAIQAGPHKTAEMREKYRQADLLLVDDVQFIAGRKQTQEEFFHTFNTLHEAGRQIVLTSDRPPSEMTTLEDRLRTRFEGGLLVDVAPPDFETRVAIVQNKAALQGLALPKEITYTIARNVTANVRQLEGTVNKLLAYRDLLGSDADEATVIRAMQDILKSSNEYIPTPESILDFVSRYYHIDTETICGQQRTKESVVARQVAMYLIRSMTSITQDDIGKIFGNRDHATVIYSLKQIEKKMKDDPSFAETVKELKTNINAHH